MIFFFYAHLRWCIHVITPGGVLSPKSYVDVPAGPRKSDYLYTNFLPNFLPISIPFSKEKHPIWAPLSLMKTPPPIAIPNFVKKWPKRQAHIRIPCQCENSPPSGVITLNCSLGTKLSIAGYFPFAHFSKTFTRWKKYSPCGKVFVQQLNLTNFLFLCFKVARLAKSMI